MSPENPFLAEENPPLRPVSRLLAVNGRTYPLAVDPRQPNSVPIRVKL